VTGGRGGVRAAIRTRELREANGYDRGRSESIERRRGPSKATGLLRRGASTLDILSGRNRREAIASRQ